jgi:hypothetical protein
MYSLSFSASDDKDEPRREVVDDPRSEVVDDPRREVDELRAASSRSRRARRCLS